MLGANHGDRVHPFHSWHRRLFDRHIQHHSPTDGSKFSLHFSGIWCTIQWNCLQWLCNSTFFYPVVKNYACGTWTMIIIITPNLIMVGPHALMFLRNICRHNNYTCCFQLHCICPLVKNYECRKDNCSQFDSGLVSKEISWYSDQDKLKFTENEFETG